jgi:hypothetical protein
MHHSVTPPLPDSNASILLTQFAYLLAGKLSTLGHIRLQIACVGLTTFLGLKLPASSLSDLMH